MEIFFKCFHLILIHSAERMKPPSRTIVVRSQSSYEGVYTEEKIALSRWYNWTSPAPAKAIIPKNWLVFTAMDPKCHR